MSTSSNNSISKKELKNITYSPKILIAWKEAISGNKKIKDWLTLNGYKELGVFCHALTNDFKAKNWLMDNGYPHLLALINGAEGDQKALQWLLLLKFDLLFHMAKAADSYKDSKAFLKLRDPLLLAIAIEMEIIKDEIDDNYKDPHKLNP
mgnify:CR=1 FL=1|jgi:hypothetical protein